MKRDTKQLIVNTAIELFNDRGVAPVTTNHIAAACNLSPGNLYYHFKNKEAIIRLIFEIITTEYYDIMEITSSEDSRKSSVNKGHISDLLLQGTAILHRYRFFYCELPTLIAADPELKEMYIVNQKEKQKIIRNMIHQLIAQKLVCSNLDEKQIGFLIESSWLHTDLWISYLHIGGEDITYENIERGIMGYFTVLTPFFTESGKIELKKQLS